MSDAIEIPLTRGRHALIDRDDYHLVSGYKWHAVENKGKAYASTSSRKSRLKMEHLLLCHKQNRHTVVDHINGNSLDNRRSNLRIVSSKFNAASRNFKSKFGYRGVEKSRDQYCARIYFDGHGYFLGRFDTTIEAAIAYNLAAFQIYGEDWFFNFTGDFDV